MEKYRIDFASNNGTDYRVSIFDHNYSGQPIALEGGAVPFQKDGDADENFFKGIRTSTAKLSVIVGENDSLMDDLFPTNNVKRAVQLIKYSPNMQSYTVEWQGFLSCEAYTQEFTDRVRELVIPCNSVLAAMDSKQVDESVFNGLMQIGYVIDNLFQYTMNESEIYCDYCRPTKDANILEKYISTALFYEKKEVCNEDTTTYKMEGVSCKRVLEMIAVYMGWCVSEEGTTIYFRRQGDTLANMVYCQEIMGDTTPASLFSKDIDDIDYMGDGHQISINSGAKSVEVVANVGNVDNNKIKLPDCPLGNIIKGNYQITEGTDYKRLYYIGNKNDTFNTTIISFTHKKMMCRRFAEDVYAITNILANMTNEERLVKSMLCGRWNSWAGGTFMESQRIIEGGHIDTYYPAESYMAKIAIHDELTNTPSYNSGVILSMIPYSGTLPMPLEPEVIFSVKSVGEVVINKTGNLHFTMDWKPLYDDGHLDLIDRRNYDLGGIYLYIKFGNRYWNGSEWVNTRTKFHNYISVKDENPKTVEFDMPVVAGDCGHLSVEVCHGMIVTFAESHVFTTLFKTICQELFVSKMEIAYKDDAERKDAGENHYYRLLGVDFANDESINTDLATDLNNHPSDHILLNDDEDKTVMTSLDYTDGTRRPEVDLLTRMATHYGAAKRKLTLQVEHPTEPLPLLRVTDDGKTYIPVAESRDYAADTSEITLLEV